MILYIIGIIAVRYSKMDIHMPYNLVWIVPQRLLIFDINEQLINNELQLVDQTINQMLDSAAQTEGKPLAHMITDLSHTVHLPSLGQINKGLTYPKHPQIGWGMIVGVRQPMLKMAAGIIPQLFKVQARVLDNLEEALNFIQSMDITMPDLIPFATAAKLGVDVTKLTGKPAAESS